MKFASPLVSVQQLLVPGIIASTEGFDYPKPPWPAQETDYTLMFPSGISFNLTILCSVRQLNRSQAVVAGVATMSVVPTSSEPAAQAILVPSKPSCWECLPGSCPETCFLYAQGILNEDTSPWTATIECQLDPGSSSTPLNATSRPSLLWNLTLDVERRPSSPPTPPVMGSQHGRGHWIVSEWGAWERPCGGAHRYRNLTCVLNTSDNGSGGTQGIASFTTVGTAFCLEPPPGPAWEYGRTQPCPGVHIFRYPWEWSSCFAVCGGTVKSRALPECRASNGTSISWSGNCPGPEPTQLEEFRCSDARFCQWVSGVFHICDNATNLQLRRVECQNDLGDKVYDDSCMTSVGDSGLVEAMPDTSRACLPNAIIYPSPDFIYLSTDTILIITGSFFDTLSPSNNLVHVAYGHTEDKLFAYPLSFVSQVAADGRNLTVALRTPLGVDAVGYALFVRASNGNGNFTSWNRVSATVGLAPPALVLPATNSPGPPPALTTAETLLTVTGSLFSLTNGSDNGILLVSGNGVQAPSAELVSVLDEGHTAILKLTSCVSTRLVGSNL